MALFLRFGGIEYDDDERAGAKLDAFVRWVQNIVERYEGTFIDLNIGDKGSYIYITFGAPIAHEDNATRAAAAALELQKPPAELDFIEPVQIGISQGRMRTGSYGGAMHRTYGALGDEVNLAARLMMAARPGQALVSRTAQVDIADQFEWGELPPLRVKGKRDAVVVFELRGAKRRTMHLADVHTNPLVGREPELALINAKIEAALCGRGQVVSMVAEAGIGKSRLVTAAVERAEILDFVTHAGECESFGINSSYLVWQPIWRTLFDIDPDLEVDAQIDALYQYVRALDPRLARRVPLLGPVLNLPIPDNELTESFDAKLRKSSLEALLIDCLRILSRRRPILIVLEDCQWIDALSQDLLEVLGQSTSDLLVLILYTYRPLVLERLESERLTGLPHYTRLHLEPLSGATLGKLARRRLAQEPGAPPADAIPDTLIQRIVERAEGNPFFLEELVNYIGDRAFAAGNVDAVAQLELPSSLHSLVLARLDRLSDRQRTLLKIASVIGRAFRVDWLLGVYPELGQPAQVQEDLVYLSEQELTHREQGQTESAYSFNHIITHGVIYESLPHMVRTTLHEQIGEFIEVQLSRRAWSSTSTCWPTTSTTAPTATASAGIYAGQGTPPRRPMRTRRRLTTTVGFCRCWTPRSASTCCASWAWCCNW